MIDRFILEIKSIDELHESGYIIYSARASQPLESSASTTSSATRCAGAPACRRIRRGRVGGGREASSRVGAECVQKEAGGDVRPGAGRCDPSPRPDYHAADGPGTGSTCCGVEPGGGYVCCAGDPMVGAAPATPLPVMDVD